MFFSTCGNANPSAFDLGSFAQVPFENTTGRVGTNMVSVSDLNCFKVGFMKLLAVQSRMSNTVTV